MGDAAAQTAAAVIAPWNFAVDGPAGEDGVVLYRSGTSMLGIGETISSCALTDEMGPQVTLTTFQSAMTAAIGTDEGQPLLGSDSRSWLIAGPRDEQYVLALKVSNATGRNLATLWIQRRAALSH